MLKITLKQMLEELTECILEGEEPEKYFWKAEYEEGNVVYLPIIQVDLMDSRFRTSDDDFSEYEWEIEESRIYKQI